MCRWILRNFKTFTPATEHIRRRDDSFKLKTFTSVSMISVCSKDQLDGQVKVYKTVVRPAMMYEAEIWAVKKMYEKI